MTRNSSGDEIANVSFLYDDFVCVLYKKLRYVSSRSLKSTQECMGKIKITFHPHVIPLSTSVDRPSPTELPPSR